MYTKAIVCSPRGVLSCEFTRVSHGEPPFAERGLPGQSVLDSRFEEGYHCPTSLGLPVRPRAARVSAGRNHTTSVSLYYAVVRPIRPVRSTGQSLATERPMARIELDPAGGALRTPVSTFRRYLVDSASKKRKKMKIEKKKNDFTYLVLIESTYLLVTYELFSHFSDDYIEQICDFTITC